MAWGLEDEHNVAVCHLIFLFEIHLMANKSTNGRAAQALAYDDLRLFSASFMRYAL